MRVQLDLCTLFIIVNKDLARLVILEENQEIEIIESTPTGGFSGWIASQVVEKLEARTRKKG